MWERLCERGSEGVWMCLKIRVVCVCLCVRVWAFCWDCHVMLTLVWHLTGGGRSTTGTVIANLIYLRNQRKLGEESVNPLQRSISPSLPLPSTLSSSPPDHNLPSATSSTSTVSVTSSTASIGVLGSSPPPSRPQSAVQLSAPSPLRASFLYSSSPMVCLCLHVVALYNEWESVRVCVCMCTWVKEDDCFW